MANRDTSRIRIKFFAQTTVPTGSGAAPDPVDNTSNVYACVTDGPTWSGFTRGDVETTCSNTTLDAWGNLIKTFRSGKIVDLGTITFTVDWDVTNTYGGRELAAFMDGRSGVLIVEFPAESGETTGPSDVNFGASSFLLSRAKRLAPKLTSLATATSSPRWVLCFQKALVLARWQNWFTRSAALPTRLLSDWTSPPHPLLRFYNGHFIQSS